MLDISVSREIGGEQRELMAGCRQRGPRVEVLTDRLVQLTAEATVGADCYKRQWEGTAVEMPDEVKMPVGNGTCER